MTQFGTPMVPRKAMKKNLAEVDSHIAVHFTTLNCQHSGHGNRTTNGQEFRRMKQNNSCSLVPVRGCLIPKLRLGMPVAESFYFASPERAGHVRLFGFTLLNSITLQIRQEASSRLLLFLEAELRAFASPSRAWERGANRFFINV